MGYRETGFRNHGLQTAISERNTKDGRKLRLLSFCNRAWRRSDKADSILELDSLVSLQHLSAQNIFFSQFFILCTVPTCLSLSCPEQGAAQLH